MKFISNISFNVILVLLFSGIIFSQNIKDETIKYSKNTSLREISEKYLDSPDLWESILSYNNIDSLDKLENGTLLTIPRSLVLNTKSSLQETKHLIKEATDNGAEIFAKVELDSSLENLLLAQESITLNNWDTAHNSVDTALQYAIEALEKAKSMRNKMADATLSQRIGDVEKKRPTKNWKDADLYTELYEKDRARTLDLSSGEISFYDLSRFNLSENSQAIIQKSRIDLLKDRNKSTVTLVQGEAFAKLVRNPKENFKVEIPGLTTKVNSKYFWVEKKKGSTKIANYDGEIEIGNEKATVTIKSNQGTVVQDNKSPTKPEELLKYPELLSPINESQFYNVTILLKWKEVPEAAQYRIQISTDPSSKNVVKEYTGILSTEHNIANFTPGKYYWSVASVNDNGLPGKYSNSSTFSILKDNYSPFLVITSPANFSASKESKIEIIGQSENNISVKINGQNITTLAGGIFSKSINLNEGSNKIQIEAIDEAGNKSTASRMIFCELLPNVKLSITNEVFEGSDRKLYTNQSELAIHGTTRPLSQLTFSRSTVTVNSFADSTGQFNVLLPVDESGASFSCNVLSPAGYKLDTKIYIEYDNLPPSINIKPIPDATNKSKLTITGNVLDTDILLVNSAKYELVNNNIDTIINLKEGENFVSIIAKDRAGNSAKIEKNVLLDITPPELLKHSLKRVSGKPKRTYMLEISTRDYSSIKRISKVFFKVDNKEIVKYIERVGTTNNYKAKIDFSTFASKPILKKIVLSDYLDNSKEYIIKN